MEKGDNCNNQVKVSTNYVTHTYQIQLFKNKNEFLNV